MMRVTQTILQSSYILTDYFTELVSGFQGTSILNTVQNKNQNSLFKWGHIANTYSALCSLLALGDDLSRINRESIIKSMLKQLSTKCVRDL